MLNIKPFAPLTSLTSCCTNFVDLFHTNHTTADHTVHLITLELQHSYHKPRSFHSLRLHHCHQPPTTTTHLNALRVTPSSTLNHSHLPLFLFPSYTVLIKAGCKITCVCVCVCVCVYLSSLQIHTYCGISTGLWNGSAMFLTISLRSQSSHCSKQINLLHIYLNPYFFTLVCHTSTDPCLLSQQKS